MVDDHGVRKEIRGDISKIHRLIGLSPLQQAVIRNMFFMSARLPGTRQIRKMIGHLLTGARIVYGVPIFMTVTPSERHSGWSIRFFRARRSDPGVTVGNSEFEPFIGYAVPPLYGSNVDCETCDVELPECDLRRTITHRDPLCALYAFLANVRVVLPHLYGVRMCPDCPHCVQTSSPCMDIFGSNANPIGGSAGRFDALVGAVEAQKAEGVLHLHFFLSVRTNGIPTPHTEGARRNVPYADAKARCLEAVR